LSVETIIWILRILCKFFGHVFGKAKRIWGFFPLFIFYFENPWYEMEKPELVFWWKCYDQFFEMVSAYQLLVTARKYEKYIIYFLWKSKQKSRIVQSYFFLLTLCFSIRLWNFEFFKKYVFSEITFFRKVRDANIHSESFLNFDSAHFAI